jgi:hypothetical protein
MKTLFLAAMFLLVWNTPKAQDRIYLRDCTRIKVKILSADSAWITYQKQKHVKAEPRKIATRLVYALQQGTDTITNAYGARFSSPYYWPKYYCHEAGNYKPVAMRCLISGGILLAGGAALFAYAPIYNRQVYGNRDTTNMPTDYTTPYVYIFGFMLAGGGTALTIVGSVYLHRYLMFRKDAFAISFEPLLAPSLNLNNTYAAGRMRVQF